MPLSADMLDRDMRAMFADLPQTVTIRRGRRVVADNAPCAADEAGGGRELNDGTAGADWDGTVSVTVRCADCATPPRVNDTAVLGGSPRRWRVTSVRRVPGDAAWQIEMGGA